MPKKKNEEVVEEVVEEVAVEETPAETGIGLFTDSFQRDDLNRLRDKLNEVIAKING